MILCSARDYSLFVALFSIMNTSLYYDFHGNIVREKKF